MGGLGSTRWHGHERRRLVEESACLDVARLAKDATSRLLGDGGLSGRVSWAETRTGQPIASAFYLLRPEEGALAVSTRPDGSDGQVVALARVSVGFSRRVHAACPAGCGRRARKLYLPEGAKGFACRGCHGLAYRSAQTHDARVDRLRGDPEAALAAFRRLSAGDPGSLAAARLILRAAAHVR